MALLTSPLSSGKEALQKAMFPTTITEPLPTNDGYTWTIASRIAQAMREAESLYGPRDKNYFFAGFEFCKDAPQLWYPGNCMRVVMQLNINAMNDAGLAAYQLSHEVIHLLSPTGGRNANVMEEGLALYFSEYFSGKNGFPNIRCTIPSYIDARNHVLELLKKDKDAIRTLRTIEPCISKITADQICERYPDISPILAKLLTSKFERGA